MKLFKPISVLSLTLFNTTQAFYLALDDGKATTGTSTCLKLSAWDWVLTKECKDANQFSLLNNKLCFAKNSKSSTMCLSTTSLPKITTFSTETNRHISVKEFNETGGYLHVDGVGGIVKKYKYSQKKKMFITADVQPLTFPSSDGHWKFNAGDGNGDLCWTGRYTTNVVFLNLCRSSEKNKIRNRIQFWKNEGAQIKSSDGIMCLTTIGNRVFTIKCDSGNGTSIFNVLHDREIAHTHRPGMCLIPRLHGRRVIKWGTCARRLKLVNSLE